MVMYEQMEGLIKTNAIEIERQVDKALFKGSSGQTNDKEAIFHFLLFQLFIILAF